LKSFRLAFRTRAAKQWAKLDATIRRQFEKKIAERLAGPRVPGDRLARYADCYKIKLRAAGYRLIYRVDDERIVILVLTVGKRQHVYDELDAELRRRP
jgi:mRNA interferase RelE/StbE